MGKFVRSKRTAAIMLFATLLYSVYAAQPDRAPAATKSDVATYTAVDFSFTGPDSLPAGWTTFHIENKGKDLHHIQLIRLTEGKTRDDVEAVLKIDPALAKPPSWMKFGGGPNAIVPGEVGTASVRLEPGNYLLICVIPDPQGVPHAVHGMIKSVTVSPSAKQKTAAPKASRSIALSDFSFAIQKPLTSGKQTIEVMNTGSQEHELVLVELPPNATVQDFGRHFMPDAPTAGGPPPGKPIGGVVGLDKGDRAYFTADLTPGRYGLICFMPDTAGGGQPHFTRGMMADFTIP